MSNPNIRDLVHMESMSYVHVKMKYGSCFYATIVDLREMLKFVQDMDIQDPKWVNKITTDEKERKFLLTHVDEIPNRMSHRRESWVSANKIVCDLCKQENLVEVDWTNTKPCPFCKLPIDFVY